MSRESFPGNSETLLEEAESFITASPSLDEVLDPEEVVEEAEQLLREAAPHDFDLLVIGGGPGGYTCALRAAQLGARVGLVERSEIGGVCVNRGCIPAKALLESTKVLKLLQRASEFGIKTSGEYSADITAMTNRKNQIVQSQREQIELMLSRAGVVIISGRASFSNTHEIEIEEEQDTRIVRAVSIVIATGSRPVRLAVPGCDEAGVLTSDEILQLESVPESLVVIGAGAVGIEFAYLYQVLGARVTILEMTGQIMPAEDEDIALEMSRILERDGIEIITRAKLSRIENHTERGENLQLLYERDGREYSLHAECALMATGRKANSENLNLEIAGVLCEDGKITADKRCETTASGVYAIGDCIRDVGWAHQATAEGLMVAEEICRRASTVDLSLIPSCYYTQPEVASVGLSLKQAREKNIPARSGVFHFRANGRAAVAGECDGFVKIVIDEHTEKILGCQIIGPRATDLINEALLAIKNGQTVEEMISAVHTHPAFNEALPEAALAARNSEPQT